MAGEWGKADGSPLRLNDCFPLTTFKTREDLNLYNSVCINRFRRTDETRAGFRIVTPL